MATQSVTQLTKIEREENIDVGLAGLMRILMRRTYRGDPNYNSLGALTDEELVTISNQARNVHTAALEGLATVGNLVSCFNPECDELNHNSIGWLTSHLSETVGQMLEVESCANWELASRGYDPLGSPLPQRAAA